MRVSAIVPTYNRAHLLRRAVQSILRQTFTEMEIVIVDDGSTDATEEEVRGYQGGAVPLRYVRKANGGCASARNRGVDVATGDLIAFLDSDDEWLPDAIRSMVDALVRAGADFVYSPSVEVVADGVQFTSRPAAAGTPELFAREHFMTSRVRSCAMMYGRHVFDAVRFDETLRYNEDSDFVQRVALTFKAAYCPQPTGRVHHHGANKSRDRIAICRSMLQSVDSILAKHPEFLHALGASAEARRREIREELVEALLVSGDVSGARATAAGGRLRPGLDLLLRLGWGGPLRWKTLAERAAVKASSLRKRAGW